MLQMVDLRLCEATSGASLKLCWFKFQIKQIFFVASGQLINLTFNVN